MQDLFYASSGAMPLDQADGLRRLFTGASPRFIALVANPYVSFGGVAIERLTAALALAGRHTLVLDAAETSPPAPEGAAIELAPCIETLSPEVSYLAARGLPLRYVNTRGSSARLIDELCIAAPQADVVLVHAGASDLARLFSAQPLRPLLLAADHPSSVKHAYASLKLLAQRSGWMSCDLLIVSAAHSPRLPHIAASLASCADTFIGAAVAGWTTIDPATDASELPDQSLRSLVDHHLGLHDEAFVVARQASPRRSAGATAQLTPRH